MQPIERFFAKVAKGETCWQWTGATRGTRQKRGCFWNGSKNVDAARWLYAHLHPTEPLDGKVVRHSCDNPLCVNPAHLLTGTQADNVADMWARGRANVEAIKAGAAKGVAMLMADPSLRARGPSHGMYGKAHLKGEANKAAKLSEDDVRTIRTLAGELSQRAIARRFGVSQGVVWRVIQGETWSHVQ